MEMTEKIDAYLDGQIKGEELDEFNRQLESDKELASEVLFHREIVECITDDEVYYLRQKLSLLIAKSSKRLPLVKTISSIAAGALIVLSLFYITNSTPSEAYSNFYEPYQTDLTTRSIETSTQGLHFAFKLYAEGEYETAFEILSNYNKENFINTTAIYYQGLCALELNKNEIAVQNFTTVISEGDYAYSLHAKWYLSMLYLKTEQYIKADQLLEELAEHPNFYAERSRKILKKYF